MRGDHRKQGAIFSYIAPEVRVPQDLPLRASLVMTDQVLRELSPQFEKMYSTVWRPSIRPEMLLRALPLQVGSVKIVSHFRSWIPNLNCISKSTRRARPQAG